MLNAFVSLVPAPLARRTTQLFARATTTRRARHTMSTAPIPLSPTVDVHIVPILSDNFSYLVHDKTANVAVVVDPAEPEKLIKKADSLNANLTTALITHHHEDHAGGNLKLASLIRDVDIIGSAYEFGNALTVKMKTGETRKVKGSQLSYTALRTPCHTMGHLCFTIDTERPVVFTGDTLFVAGCGKFFEGSAIHMDVSLNQTLAALPNEALVFCGHEYTVTNLLFARSVDTSNARVEEKLQWAKDQIANGKHTVPSTIGDEKEFNPFMRIDRPEIASALGLTNPSSVEVMKALRERKNSFRP